MACPIKYVSGFIGSGLQRSPVSFLRCEHKLSHCDRYQLITTPIMTNQLASSDPNDCHPSPLAVVASTQPLEISIDSSSSSSFLSMLAVLVPAQEQHNDVHHDNGGLDSTDATEVISLLDTALALFDNDDEGGATIEELLMVVTEEVEYSLRHKQHTEEGAAQIIEDDC